MATHRAHSVVLRRSSATCYIVAACSLTIAACGRAPPPPPPPPESMPFPAALQQRIHASILERVLGREVLRIGEPVAAICLGMGEAASPPPVDLLLHFVSGEPPLQGPAGCTRSSDPDTELAVIRTTEGSPAAFVTLTEATDFRGRAVLVRIEKTGQVPYTLRCRLDLVVLGAAEEREDPTDPRNVEAMELLVEEGQRRARLQPLIDER